MNRTNVLLTVPYSSTYPWPVAADGTGHSIVLANPTYGEGDPRAWDISDVVGGSPGQMDAIHSQPAAQRGHQRNSAALGKSRRAAVHRTLQSQHEQRGCFRLHFDR